MNYFFFLDSVKNYSSSVELFNKPSCSHLNKNVVNDKHIYAVYSNGEKWESFYFGTIKANDSILIKKQDLPDNFKNESVFIFMCEKIIKDFNQLPILKNEMITSPEWRSNLKITNNFTSTSYQGEFPDMMINKNLSVVSCSPMIQNYNNISNYLFLINLRQNPKKISFNVELLNSNKKIIGEFQATTNTVNFFNLNQYTANTNDNVFIVRTRDYGGIPIYFSHSCDERKLSLEHTHPPSSYLIFGDTMSFQKKKKIFWS